MKLEFHVFGNPAPQGSKRHVGNGVMVESSKNVKPWRSEVSAAARAEADRIGWQTPDGPVRVAVRFDLARPKHHFGTGRNAGALKPTAPNWVATKPDADKLVRAVLDALTAAGIFRDDSQIAELHVRKTYSVTTGAEITVKPLNR